MCSNCLQKQPITGIRLFICMKLTSKTKPAVAVARQMMSEVEQYLSSYEKKQAGTPIDKATNGRMTTTEAELKQLGKEMNKMPTNAQVIQSGMVPDPIQ
jgi:hypothetical protein